MDIYTYVLHRQCIVMKHYQSSWEPMTGHDVPQQLIGKKISCRALKKLNTSDVQFLLPLRWKTWMTVDEVAGEKDAVFESCHRHKHVSAPLIGSRVPRRIRSTWDRGIMLDQGG